MSALKLQSESTLTDRYQTTIPHVVRETLSLNKRDKIMYLVGQDNSVFISKIEKAEEEDDPVLDKFLLFLASDIENNPDNIKGFDENLIALARSLVDGVEVDLNAPLLDEDD